MAQADDLRASIKVCMFDQYGTVVDMQTGLTEAAAPFLAEKGWQGDPNSFVTWWRRTHFEAVHRQADRAGQNFRRSGCDRYRKRASAGRIARPHRLDRRLEP